MRARVINEERARRNTQPRAKRPCMGHPNTKRDGEKSELQKLRDFDRQQHIQKGIEAGLSREEAERHADEDLSERDDSQP